MVPSARTQLGNPLVSIGMPIYNAARYLRQAVESFLSQSFSDLELIISDNASTDETRLICEEYAARDLRVRYHRQPRNLGAPRNWNAVFREARGEFFKWASGNDYCARTTLARCVEAMQHDPKVVLCYGRTELVDDDGRPLGMYGGDFDVPDACPSDRFARVCESLSLNNAQQGLVRRAVLRRTGLDRLYPGGDLALTAELALYGRMLLLPDIMLYRRQDPGTMMAMRSPTEVQSIYNPQARTPMKLVRARLHWDHLISIGRAPIPLSEKVRAWSHAVRYAKWDRAKVWAELCSIVGGRTSSG